MTRPIPQPDWSGAWAELTGYVREARDDGCALIAEDLLIYMRELEHKALAPVRAWMDGVRGE